MITFFGKFSVYPLYFTLFIAGVLGITWTILLRSRLKIHWLFSALLSVGLVFYCIYAVKFFALAEAGFDPSKSGGMSLYGVPFFVPLYLYLGALLFRQHFSDFFDVFTVNTVLICIAGRANCFFHGCCLGVLIPGTSFRVPTREIEIVFYVVFLILLIPRIYRNKTHGEAYPLYMLGYGVLRFILEFLRSTNFETLFHLAHLWSLLSALIGLSMLLTLRERASKRRRT